MHCSKMDKGLKPVVAPIPGVDISSRSSSNLTFATPFSISTESCTGLSVKLRTSLLAVRLAIRRKKSKPLVKLLRKTIVQAQAALTPSHDLMKAISYTLKHWIALTRFLKNPDYRHRQQ